MEYGKQSQDSNYDDSAPADEGAEPAKGDESKDTQTTVVPKEILPGNCKPGEKLVFEVVALHDNEAELKYVGYDKKEEQGEEAAPSEPPQSGSGGTDGVQSMME